MPVVVGIVEVGAAVALHVDRDEAVALVHEGKDGVPGIPALRQPVEEQDHLAVGCPRLDVVPADAVDDPIVVVVGRVDGIVGGLKVRPELRVFGGKAPRAARGGNPDDRCPHRAEASEAEQRPRPKTALHGPAPFPAELLIWKDSSRGWGRACSRSGPCDDGHPDMRGSAGPLPHDSESSPRCLGLGARVGIA
jgi:hypothetical protein